MANPITWRNVNGPSLAEAARPLESSQNIIGGAFDRFNALLKQRESTDAANVATTNNNAKLDYQTMLAGFSTPEQLQAARDSGVLNERLQALAPSVRGDVLNAADTRLTNLFQQSKAAGEYKDYSLDRAQLPITQNIMSLASQGKKEEALQAMKDNPDIRMPAPLMDAIVKGDRDLTKFGWDQQNQLWKGETHSMDMRKGESDLKTAAANRGLIGAQTANAGIQNQIGKLNLSDLQEQRAAEGVLGKLAGAYQSTVADARAKIGTAAVEFGKTNGEIPTDRNGVVDTSKMTSKQLNDFDKYLKDKGLPSTDILTRGDTKEAAAAKDFLVKSGVRPSVIGKLTPQLEQVFNSGPMDKIGNDAYASDLRSRQRDYINQNLKEAHGAIATFGDVGNLMKAVDDEIESQKKTRNDDWFSNSVSSSDLQNIRSEVSKYLQKGGIKVGSGDNETRIMPGPDQLRLIIQESGPSEFGFTANTIKKALENWDKNQGKAASQLYTNNLQGRGEEVIDPKKTNNKKGK
jgi:hypothetical protein